jgi:hypothetical protein
MKTKLMQKTTYSGEKRGTAMKKIVILSSKPKPDAYFLELVKMLFPESEVCVVSGMGKMLAQCQSDSFSGLGAMEPIGRA